MKPARVALTLMAVIGVVSASLPPESASIIAPYTTMPGDTAIRIAARNELTIEQLQSLNPDTNWARLKVGQQIRVR